MKTFLCALLAACCLCSRGAVQFDGSNDVLGTATNALNGPFPLTVAAWIYVAGRAELDYGVVAGREVVSSRGWHFIASTDGGYGTNSLYFQYICATTPVSKRTAVNVIPRNQWTHVAVTWDGTIATNGLWLYINGVMSPSAQATTGVGAFTADPNLPISVGNRYNTTITFNGMITEVAIWTNALRADEIATLAAPSVTRIPLHVRPSTLVCYWPLDGGPDGASAGAINGMADLSGRGNHLSPTNAPTWRGSPLSYP